MNHRSTAVALGILAAITVGTVPAAARDRTPTSTADVPSPAATCAEIHRRYVTSLSAEALRAELRDAASQFVSPETRRLFEDGILEPIGGQAAVPRFANAGAAC